MRRETFKFWDLLCLILETLRYWIRPEADELISSDSLRHALFNVNLQVSMYRGDVSCLWKWHPISWSSWATCTVCGRAHSSWTLTGPSPLYHWWSWGTDLRRYRHMEYMPVEGLTQWGRAKTAIILLEYSHLPLISFLHAGCSLL